jgi:hypothetical protein
MNTDQQHNFEILCMMRDALRSLRPLLRTMPFDDVHAVTKLLHDELEQDNPVEAAIYVAIGSVAMMMITADQKNIEPLAVVGGTSFMVYNPDGSVDLSQAFTNCGQPFRGILAINALAKDSEDIGNVIFVHDELIEAATDEILRLKQAQRNVARSTDLN